MSKFWIILLTVIGTLLFAGALGYLVALVVGQINGLSVYEQLCSWFGHGSWFANLFK